MVSDMKVLFVHNAFFPYAVGGAEHSLLDRCKTLKNKGVETEVAFVSPGKSEVYEYEGIPVRSFSVFWSEFSPYHSKRSFLKKLGWHLLPYFFFWESSRDFFKYVKNGGFDAVFFVNTPGIPISWLKVSARKYAIVADYNYICCRGTMFKGGRRCERLCSECLIYRKIKSFNCSDFKGFVFISKFLLSVHRGSNLEKKSFVIYNGETEFDKNVSFVGGGGEAVVGYIGQVKPNKGVEVFFSAVSRAAELDSTRKYKCVVAGQVDEIYASETVAKYSNLKIEFLGKINKNDFYEKVELVAVPSLWDEPLGRVPFEAAFRGIGVLVSRRGGLPETVFSSDMTFDPDDEFELSNLIVNYFSMIDSERDLLLQANLNHAKKFFSSEKSAELYLSVIKDDN